MIISIDGPAGTGKSTVSRLVAQRLDLPHLDTGAYYRAATLLALRKGLDVNDERAVTAAVNASLLDQIGSRMYVDGEDVSHLIRSPEVSAAVSVVSAHGAVREALVAHQRAWVRRHGGSAVVEGRDIGSIVFPDAPVKVYLDASPEVRAARRSAETGQKATEVLVDQERRDHIDSTRVTSPLRIPEGATVIDTSDMQIDEVVGAIVELVESRLSR
ncbi:MAG: (d)CMP kinase [Actinobacteria bacterium]|nr:MAG: (d)CMP kinase [Actinomycetota bacterium]REK33893.1 MAG: (d)CMP kinase [Actinomycetota bacterium]